MLLENDSLKVTVDEGAGCLLSLRIEMKPPKVQQAYKSALKRVNKEVSIPGFRKGKAPESTIQKNYQSHIEREWREILVEEAFTGAVELTKEPPYSKRTIQRPRLEKCSLEEGAVLLISYECYPKLPKVDFSKIELPKLEPRPVEASEVEGVIAEIQKREASYEAIEGKAADWSDYVRISLDGESETGGESFPLLADRRLELKEPSVPGWLSALLLGMKADESKAHEHTGEGGLEGLPKKLKLHLHAVEKILLPDVDDALAKKVGFETSDAMRGQIRSNMEADAASELRGRKFDALSEALVESYPFDLPQTLVEDLVARNLESQERQFDSLPEAERTQQIEKLRAEIQASVIKKLRLHFLLREIGSEAKIALSQQELNDEIHRALQRNPTAFGDMKDKENFRERVSRFADILLEEKTLSYALSQVENRSA